MAVTRTIFQDLLVNTTTYTKTPLLVGDCYELGIDLNITAYVPDATLVLSRIDAFGVPIPIYTRDLSALGVGKWTIDVGPTYGYDVYRTFGDVVQIDITTSGIGASLNGTISMKGKG